MNVSFHLQIHFLRGHSAFCFQYARINEQRWRFGASPYSKSKSDVWCNLNIRYKGKLGLSVLVAMADLERRTAIGSKNSMPVTKYRKL